MRSVHRLAFLFLPALLPAQNTPPTLFGTFTQPILANQLGLVIIEGVAMAPGTQPGTWDIAAVGTQGVTSPAVARYCTFDPATNQVQNQPYLAAVNPVGFGIGMDATRLNVVFYNAGNLDLYRRANTTSPFGGRTTITGTGGTQANLSSPQLFTLNGQTYLLACGASGPTPVVWRYELDLQTGVASNGISFGPAVAANHRFQCAAAIVDPVHDAFSGYVMVERQNHSLLQRVHYTSSWSGAGPYHAMTDAPRDNILASVSPMQGGDVAFACAGLPPSSLFPEGIVVMKANMMGQRCASSSSAGVVRFHMATPTQPASSPPALGFMAIGFENTPVAIPGFTGWLGLNAGQLLFLPTKTIPNNEGIGTCQLPVPPLPNGTELHFQGLRLDATARFHFTNTALLKWRL